MAITEERIAAIEHSLAELQDVTPTDYYESRYTGEEMDSLLDDKTGVNLLDNWYFADPIDQRSGHYAEAGTSYYTDMALTTPAGTTASAVKATPVNSVYGTITVNSTSYYVASASLKRGYVNATGNLYSLDRWRMSGSTGGMKQVDGRWCILSRGTRYGGIQQTLPLTITSGESYTFSLLWDTFDGGSWYISLVVRTASNVEIAKKTTYWNASKSLIQATVTVPSGHSHTELFLSCYVLSMESGENQLVPIAAKLELGSRQTLAHQDADGNWVLNDPPPNKALELAKCQRYFQVFSDSDLRPGNAMDYRPVMRTTPALGTITVDGKTLYTAIADL